MQPLLSRATLSKILSGLLISTVSSPSSAFLIDFSEAPFSNYTYESEYLSQGFLFRGYSPTGANTGLQIRDLTGSKAIGNYWYNGAIEMTAADNSLFDVLGLDVSASLVRTIAFIGTFADGSTIVRYATTQASYGVIVPVAFVGFEGLKSLRWGQQSNQVDNIEVAATSVPAPSPALLLLLGVPTFARRWITKKFRGRQ